MAQCDGGGGATRNLGRTHTAASCARRDAFAQRTGNGVRSLGMLIIPLVGVFFCSISTLTYISRIMFAYSRDRAVPLSFLWMKVRTSHLFLSPLHRFGLAAGGGRSGAGEARPEPFVSRVCYARCAAGAQQGARVCCVGRGAAGLHHRHAQRAFTQVSPRAVQRCTCSVR